MKSLISILILLNLSQVNAQTVNENLNELGGAKLSSAIKFNGKLPDNTLDLSIFEEKENEYNDLVKTITEEYKNFDTNYASISEELNSAKSSLEALEQLVKLNPGNSKFINIEMELLDSIGMSKDDLEAMITELVVRLDNRRASEFLVNKNLKMAKSTIQSKISHEKVESLLRSVFSSFSDCEFNKFLSDSKARKFAFSVKNLSYREPKFKKFVLSNRLPVVLQKNYSGYTLHFERDADFYRGNLSIADAKFKDEITEFRVEFNQDGSPSSLLFYSSNFDEGNVFMMCSDSKINYRSGALNTDGVTRIEKSVEGFETVGEKKNTSKALTE